MKYRGHIELISPDVLNDPIWGRAGFREYCKRLGGMPKVMNKKKYRNHIGRARSKLIRRRKAKYLGQVNFDLPPPFSGVSQIVENFEVTGNIMTTGYCIINGKNQH